MTRRREENVRAGRFHDGIWVGRLLEQSWRSRVWADAMDLVVLDPTQRAAARVVIGERASGVATVILLGRHEA